MSMPRTGHELRALARAGQWAGPTAGVAPGHAQANLVILPRAFAFDFFLFLKDNDLVTRYVSGLLLFLGAICSFLIALWLSDRAIRAHRELSRRTFGSEDQGSGIEDRGSTASS